MLAVQEYLRSGKTLDDIRSEFGVNFYLHPTLPLVGFKYDQIDSPKTHPVVRDCRGIVLERDTWNVVAKPFRRFFNAGEVIEEYRQFNWNDFTCTSKEDGCFLYRTPLNIWGGGTVYIGDVVTKKLTPTLIGMDESGNLVPCQVVDWFDNGTKNNWMEIEIDCQVSPGVESAGHPNRLRVTTNHHIHLNGEFKAAIEAKPGDRMVGHGCRPSKSVMHMIRSALLGDGSISSNGSSWRFVEGHRVDHADYVHQVTTWLGKCAVQEQHRMSGYGSLMIDSISASYKCLGELRGEWYSGGEKQPPVDLSWMDDFSVAKWHMDDGCLSHSEVQEDRAILSTHGFSYESVCRLADRLREMYGVDAVPAVNKNGWCIRINAGKNREISEY